MIIPAKRDSRKVAEEQTREHKQNMIATRFFLALLLLVLGFVAPTRAEPSNAFADAMRRHDYAKALTLLRPDADRGDPAAQTVLGEMYEGGKGLPKNEVEAAKWYRRAAEQGYALAQALLGIMYEDGKGGLPKNDVEAVKWYRRAAEQGYARAQTHLGIMYENGTGLTKNEAEAAKWYRRAAEQGDTFAQGFLGFMYENGTGLTKNEAEAAKWYRRAAEQGDAVAQAHLGGMYSLGRGVPQDYVSAYKWFNIAAAGQEPNVAADAAEFRDLLARRMSPGQIAEGQRLARAWKPVATQNGSSNAVSELKPKIATISTGSGFFVSMDGRVLTNAHVVENCRQTNLRTPNGTVSARLLARDTGNDLALLASGLNPAQIGTLRPSVRLGEEIVVYGYPLSGLLASGGNVTMGNIAALSGIRDDSRFLQISAPVQPGNSGGPVLDRQGNVVGIVVAKLDAVKLAGAIKDIPQNVNFAIKSTVAASFLDAQSVPVDAPKNETPSLSPEDLAERARALTVQIECR
jgi:TPR repeat protein